MEEKQDIRYFLYSMTQVKERNEIENKLGKIFVVGTVVDNGIRKEYSLLSKTATVDRYPDARIIAVGDINTIKYEKPTTKRKRSL